MYFTVFVVVRNYVNEYSVAYSLRGQRNVVYTPWNKNIVIPYKIQIIPSNNFYNHYIDSEINCHWC